jgi:hypothetical protein
VRHKGSARVRPSLVEGLRALGDYNTAYGQPPLQAKTPPSQVSILLPIEQPVIVQSCGEAPLQSTTQFVWALQSKVHLHPLPHLSAHGGFVQPWSQHPLEQVEQSVPHIIPVLLLAVELCAVELELDAVLAPPMPAPVLLVVLLDVKLPPMPFPEELLDPLAVVVPMKPVCSNWSKFCVQPT